MKYNKGPIAQELCKNGHLIDGDNLIQKYNKNGTRNGRKCRLCEKDTIQRKSIELKAKHRLQKLYNLSSYEDVYKLLASQGNACAICGTTGCTWGKGFRNKWHIDHKHDGTANHRGIICSQCNHTIGRANDDPALLRKMADYIESYQKCTIPPDGWYCTREKGHEGPCAAHPKEV